ncbi:hypothetical protein [Lysinibacillus sp. NPDC056185]|uniref:hypothetical protein n=1 Tax=Lysinibacillus sp. NPDC056185 TaxID=3345739 RepID=UPI0039F123AE
MDFFCARAKRQQQKQLIRHPKEALLCAKAKRQQQMFYLCESEAAATKRSVRTEITPRFAKMTISLSQKQKGCIS